jgi:predicted nucleotide-binding protein
MNIGYGSPLKPRIPLHEALPLLKLQREEGNSLIGHDTNPKVLTVWLNQTRSVLNEIFSIEVINSKLNHEPKPDYEILDEYLGLLDNYIKKIEHQLELSNTPQRSKKIDNRRIFIVHGHNNELKNEVEQFLKELELEPIILHKQADRGKTIIEKVEYYSDVGFAVIILSHDDFGSSTLGYNLDFLKEIAKHIGWFGDPIVEAVHGGNFPGVYHDFLPKYQKISKLLDLLRYRARQNVIFEFGYFIAILGRNRVAVLCEEDIERPSDIDGLLYTPIDDKSNWKKKLAKEIDAAGIRINERDL